MSEPSLGQLFAEVWDLCDQLAATITDDEVEEKLDELRRWAWLEKAVAEPLPPCEMRVGPHPLSVAKQVPPPCGKPAVAVLTFTCSAGCRPPWRRSACDPCVRECRLPGSHCGYCDAPLLVGGLS